MVPNLRDVAESVELVAERPLLRPGLLFRGGTVNRLFDETELPPIETILNLRKGPDRLFRGVVNLHHPAQDRKDNYLTSASSVQRWLQEGLVKVTQARWPLLVHCTSGRDRTGVFIGLVLFVVGIEPSIIMDEYELSDGVTAGHRQLFAKSLDGFTAHQGWLVPELATALRRRLRLDEA
ncbi:MAG: tyrosine-protein phosphatase [Myxococcota bacterium]